MNDRTAENQLTLKGHIRTAAGGHRLPDDAYNARWLDRVKARLVIDANGCWVWQGTLGTKGYGQTGYRGTTMHVHRAMYMLVHGTRLRIDQLVCHSCDNRPCCNPDHLWLGDARLNSHDSTAKGRHHNQLRTHCPRGHELTPENVYIKKRWPGPTGILPRSCKRCSIVRSRLKLGWTEEEAEAIGKVPHGYSRKRLPLTENS